MEAMCNIFQRPDIYEVMLRDEMQKLGATEVDLNLISDALIWNSIKNKRHPVDVAWALMQ